MLLIDNLNIGCIVLLILNQTSAAFVSYNQPKFCSFPSWNPNGITFANSSQIGYSAYGIFIDINNTIYASAENRKSILVWTEEGDDPSSIISNNLSTPRSLFVTASGDVYVDDESNRVQKCSMKTRSCNTIMYVQRSCDGLFIDINGTIYCSMAKHHQVIKKSLDWGSNTSVVAGGNGTGASESNTLNQPHGIFVDINFDLYVADALNHRIQRFQLDQLHGTTIAGKGAAHTIELGSPLGVVLDLDGYLFILDHGSHRVIGSRPAGFRCLVGCLGTGSLSSQLKHPTTMSFGSYGNIFVMDFMNNRIQKFLLATNSCIVSYNRPKFYPCASWNPNAITAANSSTVGQNPYGIFIDATDTIYVTNRQNKTVAIWSQGSTDLTRLLSGSLFYPHSIFVTTNGNIYVDNGSGGRVNKWTSNATNSEIIMNFNGDCFGLFVDIDNNLYCSSQDSHQILKRSLYTNINTTIIVAGGNSSGWASHLLHGPRGIFVGVNLDLYVADSGNHRIQLFRSGQSNATTIPMHGKSCSYTLSEPHGVALDGNGHLFVVDYGYHRILASGPTGFRCVVGCSGTNGLNAYQLNFPQTMSFDTHGNIYVTDRDNNRIQKFILIANSCVQSLFPSIIVSSCIDSSRIGQHCDISNTPCVIRPCLNNGTCEDDGTASSKYLCSCPSGFNGSKCQFDNRPCKSNVCWNNGQCKTPKNTTFVCLCQLGWQGTYCESKINYCKNITCMNNGVCRPLFRNYTCECLGNSYSGRHCEVTSIKIKIYNTVAKSFAYVAIIAIIAVVVFIIIMDILKYGFGIDPTREELKRIRQKKHMEKYKSALVYRFVYINPSVSDKSIAVDDKTKI